MAVRSLSLAEIFRPWRSAGLDTLLADEDAPGSFARSENSCEAQDPKRSEESPTPVSELPFAPASPPPRRNTPQPLTAQRPAPAKSAPLSAEASACSSPDTWPVPWQLLFARTNPAPFIWTYAELGEDLLENANQERAACLRALLGSLGLPRGSNAFWPSRLPMRSAEKMRAGATLPLEQKGEPGRFSHEAHAKEGQSAHPPQSETASLCFSGGLLLLRPKAVILLGPETAALTALGLEIRHPYMQQILRGILHITLPEFSGLCAGAEPSRKAVAFLRSLLGQFIPELKA